MKLPGLFKNQEPFNVEEIENDIPHAMAFEYHEKCIFYPIIK